MRLKKINESWDNPDVSADSLTKDKYLVSCKAYSRRIDLCGFIDRGDDDELYVIKSFSGFRDHIRNKNKFRKDFENFAKRYDFDDIKDKFGEFAKEWGYDFNDEDDLANFEYDWNRENNF